MGNDEVVFTYKGKDIRFLSYDELLKATQWAFAEIENMRKWAKEERAMEDLFHNVATALRP